MGTVDAKWGPRSFAHDPYLLANFRPRPSDVLITTAPKAGTTWMQQILHQLRTGGDNSFAAINEVVPWLEFPRPGRDLDDQLADYEAMADPRIFKTHCTYPQTPGTDVVRIVMTTRDPRDCCVSWYHHVHSYTDETRARLGAGDPSFDEAVDSWLAFASWYRNVESWWPHRNDANVLILRYEDLVADLAGVVDQLLEFLDWSLARDRRERVLTMCSFDWMRQRSAQFTRLSAADPPAFKPGGFIRRGTVGDHRGQLSAAQEEQILAEARRRLPLDCLEFLELA